MSLQATGAYLKRLREEAGFSRLSLSKKVGTSDSQIIRIEQGQETRGSLLAMIINTLQANPEDVIDLLITSEYTEDDGRKRAEQWIERRKPKTESRITIHPDVISLISRMTEYELGRWVSLGERMVEERSRNH